MIRRENLGVSYGSATVAIDVTLCAIEELNNQVTGRENRIHFLAAVYEWAPSRLILTTQIHAAIALR